MKQRIRTLDTTLRDGAQSSGISLAIEDKLKITARLDALGIDYIEGGWPGSNPKDMRYFHAVRRLRLKHALCCAFGSTRHKDVRASADKNLRAILDAKVRVASIFGKTWDLHVHHALRTSLETNLDMIYDSIKFLKSKGLTVIFDAEHFFDGFRDNRTYALAALARAADAGADNISLCDTNGGMLPSDVAAIVRVVGSRLKVPLGIHAHNDSDCAVANSLAAVEEGVTLVQGTINGIGERAGNANLASIIANLALKRGIATVSEPQLRGLTEACRYVAEVANQIPYGRQPFVGSSAFAHKGGIHVSALARHTKTYEHIDPALVGNQRRVLISELSGRSNIVIKARELKIDVNASQSDTVIAQVKAMENAGYQFEDAEASFAILMHKALRQFTPHFELLHFRVEVAKDPTKRDLNAEATVKLKLGSLIEHTVAEGDGPVNALDNALRKALLAHYPVLSEVRLTDFKVRVVNATGGTAAKVRVFATSRDHTSVWNTIGVSENLIEASWQALVDAVEYKLLKEGISAYGKKSAAQ